MATYRVHAWRKRTKEFHESPTFATHNIASGYAGKLLATGQYKVITIVRANEATDEGHPANIGQYFLDRIVK